MPLDCVKIPVSQTARVSFEKKERVTIVEDFASAIFVCGVSLSREDSPDLNPVGMGCAALVAVGKALPPDLVSLLIDFKLFKFWVGILSTPVVFLAVVSVRT